MAKKHSRTQDRRKVGIRVRGIIARRKKRRLRGQSIKIGHSLKERQDK